MTDPQLAAVDLQRPLQRNQWPAFIQGCHRSGTTLLRYLLDSHPRLACPPESKFLSGLHAFLTYPQVANALMSLGYDATRQLCLGRAVMMEVLGSYTQTQGKSRWIDKTPNYYRILDFIDDCCKHEVLFVFLVRHPLDVVESLFEAHWFRPEVTDDPDIRRILDCYGYNRGAWARYWREVYTALLSFAVSWPQRSLVIRYEDLVRRTTDTLGMVLSFLGEDASDAEQLINHAFDAQHSAGLGDWKIRETCSVHGRSIDRWRHLSDEDLTDEWAIVRDTARRLGYEGPTPTSGT